MKKISLTQFEFALIDDEDFEELSKYNWQTAICRETLRARRTGDIYMARQIMNCPSDKEVDHINGNTLDNQKQNLRICTSSDNKRNSKSMGGTSKYKGVCWCKRSKKWSSKIMLKNVFGAKFNQFLGYYNSEEAAALAYDEIARKEHGKFGRYNFPLEGEQSSL